MFGMGIPIGMPPPAAGWYNNSAPQASDGVYSHPWLWNASSNAPVVSSTWLNNLQLAFSDAATYSMSVVLNTSFDTNGAFFASNISECTGTKGLLKFMPWMPYGLTGAGYDDCQGINYAYGTWAAANPYFQAWGGWVPFTSLFSNVVYRARAANVSLREVDIEPERQLDQFTVEARLIYDNISGFNVLEYIRGALQNWGYSGSIATFSTVLVAPSADTGLNNQYGVDCLSVYNDSAMLFKESELTNAYGGGLGVFGQPLGQSYTNSLPCSPSQDGTWGMPSLPPGITYSQPSVVDVHAYPCIVYPNTGICDLADFPNPTNTIETLYSDVWSFLGNYTLTGAVASFGESSIIDFSSSCSIGGLPPSDTGAQWNVNGYKASSLIRNHAASTFFMPFDNQTSSCFSNPLNISASPYNPFN